MLSVGFCGRASTARDAAFVLSIRVHQRQKTDAAAAVLPSRIGRRATKCAASRARCRSSGPSFTARLSGLYVDDVRERRPAKRRSTTAARVKGKTESERRRGRARRVGSASRRRAVRFATSLRLCADRLASDISRRQESRGGE